MSINHKRPNPRPDGIKQNRTSKPVRARKYRKSEGLAGMKSFAQPVTFTKKSTG